MSDSLYCELCQRDVGELTLHHLIPQSEAKRHKLKIVELPTANLCRQCHKKIHSLYSNRRLGDELNTIAILSEQPAIQLYLAWVSKIPGTKVFKEHR